MGLKLIYGRAGSGKSRYCIDQIKKRIDDGKANKLILLVPEQFTFQTETKLLKEIGEKSVLNAEVLSFKRLAHRVFNECGGITHERMKDAGKSMLIYKVLENLNTDMKIFNKAIKQNGFIDIVSKTVTEFKKYNITLEILDEIIEKIDDNESELKDKLDDLKRIYADFNSKTNENYIDTDDELTILAKKLDFCNLYNGAEIWVDEFTTFTPQQLNILIKLFKKVKTINIAFVSDGKQSYDNITNIFNVTNKTEKNLLRVLKENNIAFDGIVNLNNNFLTRFKDSEELEHLEKFFFEYPIKTYDKNCNDIKIYKANNSYEEIRTVAKDIINLIRDKGYRFKDISVVCRNIDSYEKITSVIFAEYGIPYFIDKKRDVMSNPLVVLITSAFEIHLKNWSYESVFKYLKTGLVSIDREQIDLLENYVLANGIRGFKWMEEVWEYSLELNLNKSEEESLEEKRKLNILNETKDLIIEPLIKFFNTLKDAKTAKEKCYALYSFLLDLGVLRKMDALSKEFEDKGIMDKAKEYSQVQDIVMEVFDQLVEVMGSEKLGNKEFVKILQVGFEKYEMGVLPVSLDQVNIGDIARIRSREVKALYIVGVNDGVLPSANKEEGILSDRDRGILKDKGIELASDTKTKALEEQFLVYTVLTIPMNYLMITYPLADFEGKALRPSIIILKIKKIFSNLQEESDIVSRVNDKYEKITSKIPTFNNLIAALRKEYDDKEIENYWAGVYGWYKQYPEWKEKAERMFKGLIYNNQVQNVSRDKIKKLYGNGDDSKLTFSVSRIEKYAQCPFSYYVKYGLKAKERKMYEFTAPDLGSFMHSALEKFTNRVKEQHLSWRDLSKEQCKNMISKVVNEEINEKTMSILNSSKRYMYFTNTFKKILTKSVMVISEHMKRSDCEIFKNEFTFGDFKEGNPIKVETSQGDQVLFVGRIDRIDTLDLDGETYVRIIDYKTGKKKFSLNELYYGIQIQLLVYLDAILRNSKYFLEKQVLPGAILYFRIDDPIIKSDIHLDNETIENEVLKKLKMDGLILKEPKVVHAMDNSMGKNSIIIPAGFVGSDEKFSKNSSVMTERDFEKLREYVNKKIGELCEEMLNGKIQIEPVKDKTFSYCSYCEYSSICQFDTSIKDNKYKIIADKNKDEVWDDILKDLGYEKDEELGGK